MDQATSSEADPLYAIHEMCQPLTAILLNAKAALRWMDDDLPNFPEVKQSIIGLIGNAQRAADIARQARDTVRTSGAMAFLVDINEIVRDSLNLARPILGRHGIQGEMDLVDGLAPVRGNSVSSVVRSPSRSPRCLPAVTTTQCPSTSVDSR